MLRPPAAPRDRRCERSSSASPRTSRSFALHCSSPDVSRCVSDGLQRTLDTSFRRRNQTEHLLVDLCRHDIRVTGSADGFRTWVHSSIKSLNRGLRSCATEMNDEKYSSYLTNRGRGPLRSSALFQEGRELQIPGGACPTRREPSVFFLLFSRKDQQQNKFPSQPRPVPEQTLVAPAR